VCLSPPPLPSFIPKGMERKYFFRNRATIPDKKVGTPSKFSPPPTYNVDNQEIFSFLLKKTATFFDID